MPMINNKNGISVKPIDAGKPTVAPIKKEGTPVRPVGASVVPNAASSTKPATPNRPTGASVVPNAPSSIAPKDAGGRDIDEVAADVIKGKYGNGADRKAALEKAGYDPAKVQARVNELLAPKTDDLEAVAKDVIKGKYGNGAERKEALIKAGYDPAKVQEKVNELLK